MQLIQASNDWKLIPENLQPVLEGSWENPGPVTDEHFLKPDMLLSEKELGSKKLAWIFVNGDTSSYWMEALPLMTDLEALVVRGTVTQKVLERICRLRKLSKLKIDKTLAKDFSSFSLLTNLTHLALFYSSSVAQSPIEHIQAESLEALSLSMPKKNISLESINLHKYPHLKSLALGSCADTGYAVFDSLAPLSKIEALEYLTLANVKAEDQRLSVLKSMRNLKAVYMTAPEWWDTTGLV